jgi:chromosome segregation ATPase
VGRVWVDHQLEMQLKRYQELMPLSRVEELKEAQRTTAGRGKEAQGQRKAPGETQQDLSTDKEEFVRLLAEHPLLQAYEQHVQDVERVNGQLGNELAGLRRELAGRVSESEDLARQLQDKIEQLAKMNERALSPETFDIIGKELTSGKEIVSILDSLKKEHEVLLSEIDLARTRAIKAESDLKLQVQTTEDYEKKTKMIATRQVELQTALENAEHEKEVLMNRLGLRQEELNISQKERETFHGQCLRQESELKLLQRSVEQYKKAYEDLERRKDGEMDLLEKDLSEKGLALQEHKNKLLLRDRELDDLRDVKRKLERDLETTKNDFAQMIKIMEDNESRLALFDEREKSLKTREQECKRRMDEAKLQREEAIYKERQGQKQVATMEQQWKQDVEERQKKFDALLETARSKQKAVLSQSEEEYKALNDKHTKLQAAFEQLQADYKVLEGEKRQGDEALAREHKEFNDRCTTYDQQLRAQERQEIEEKRKLQNQAEDLNRTLGKIADQLKDSELQGRTLKVQLEGAEGKAEAAEQELRELRGRAAELAAERQNALRELERLKKVHQTKMADIADACNLKVYPWMTCSLRRLRTRCYNARINARRTRKRHIN